MAGQLLPAGAAEVAAPVGGQGLAFLPVTDVEILAVLAVGILAGLLEPLMLIGAVVHNQVHDNVHIPLLGLCQQAVHILHGAENGVDIVVVGDIVTLVSQRGAIDGGQPDDIHAQVLQIVQFADNTGNITNTVAVAVAKALGVDLIGSFAVPPFPFHKNLQLFSKIKRLHVDIARKMCYHRA